jgi:hypothetical protein
VLGAFPDHGFVGEESAPGGRRVSLDRRSARRHDELRQGDPRVLHLGGPRPRRRARRRRDL